MTPSYLSDFVDRQLAQTWLNSWQGLTTLTCHDGSRRFDLSKTSMDRRPSSTSAILVFWFSSQPTKRAMTARDMPATMTDGSPRDNVTLQLRGSRMERDAWRHLCTSANAARSSSGRWAGGVSHERWGHEGRICMLFFLELSPRLMGLLPVYKPPSIYFMMYDGVTQISSHETLAACEEEEMIHLRTTRRTRSQINISDLTFGDDSNDENKSNSYSFLFLCYYFVHYWIGVCNNSTGSNSRKRTYKYIFMWILLISWNVYFFCILVKK